MPARTGSKKQADAEGGARQSGRRQLAGGHHLGRARERFDLRDQDEVRNELTAAAEVACGDRTDQAGYGSPQASRRLCSGRSQCRQKELHGGQAP
jgi:hypothetical protein